MGKDEAAWVRASATSAIQRCTRHERTCTEACCSMDVCIGRKHAKMRPSGAANARKVAVEWSQLGAAHAQKRGWDAF
eukprot:40493-Chlamydomonas_euryale.AAC.6